MKNLISLFLIAATAFSCSDDDNNNNKPNACALLGLTEIHSVAANNPCAIAVSASGYIAVSEYNGGYGTIANIRIYSSYERFKSGTVSIVLSAIAPEAMVFDKDNNLYVAETEQVAGIKVFDFVGEGAYNHKKTIQDNFNNPRGLAFDSAGRLYLADDGTGRIIRFDDPFNSNTHVTIGNWDAGIKGLAINGKTMYVANYLTNSVSRNLLKDDGSFDVLDGSVTVSKATDVSTNGNTLVVTSYDNSTVSVFSNCDLSNKNKREYVDKGRIFGTAFINPTTLLTADFGADKARTFSLQ